MIPEKNVFNDLLKPINWVIKNLWIIFVIFVVCLTLIYFNVRKQHIDSHTYEKTDFLNNAKKHAPKLDIDLVFSSNKNDYIQLEPIKGLITIVDKSKVPFTVKLKGSQCAAKVVILRVFEDDHVEKIGEQSYCSNRMPDTVQWFGSRWTWTISQKKFLGFYAQRVDNQFPVNRSIFKIHWFENYFPVGDIRLRAVLTLTKPRVQYVSKDVNMRIHEPTGENLNAYEYLMGRPFGGSGLIFNGGSHHWESKHKLFLEHHPNSVYADYVRRMMER